jgi:hypothetical protein
LKINYNNSIDISFAIKLTEKERFLTSATNAFLGKITFFEGKIDFYPFNN